MQDVITVAPDRQTAKGRFRGMLFGKSHEPRDYKPEGLPLQFMEAGIYENDCVRQDVPMHFAHPRFTDTIALGDVPTVFEGLKQRTHQCKVLINPFG